MSARCWRWSIVFVSVARLMLNQVGAAPLIGVVLPQGQALQGSEAAEPMRQSLISQLKAQSIDAVPLNAAPGNLDTEAQAQQCRYVLYTHLEKRSSGGLGKLSALTHVLPFAAFSAKGAASSLASMAAQGAANAAASSAQQQAASQFAPPNTMVKQGDTMAMAYRLVAVGSANPLKAESFDSAKAGSDGQDILSPLVAHVVGAVIGTVQESPSALPATSTQPATPAASGDPASPSGHRSMFSGLWGHRSDANPKTAGESMSAGMDCAKLASMPNAPMSLEACERLQVSQQANAHAASNPAAARAGDDQMSCTEITAELKQQQYTAPDRTKVTEATATVNEQQTIIHKEYANMLKQQAEDQAAVSAATAADTATEVATLGLVRGRSLNAVDKAIDARHQANNERALKEDLPVTQKMVGQMADFGTDFGQQLTSNPRLARLMQLADARHCKGGT